MSITKSQTEKIGSIFNGNRFIIPTYQRKYSWTDNERKALWKDVEESLKDKMNHFVGTLSFKENRSVGLSTDTVYEIIDGQQRITTIFILLKVLIDKLSDANIRESQLSAFIGSKDSLKLQPLGEDGDFLKLLLFEFEKIDINTVNKRSQRFMFSAMKLFIAFSNALTSAEIEQRIIFIRDNIEVLVFNVESQAQAVKMFSIINDRGLPLRILDKTKSILMLYSTLHLKEQLNDEINNSFENIFDSYDDLLVCKENLGILGRLEENTIFTQHYYSSRKLFASTWNNRDGADTIFDNLKTKCEELKEKPSELESFISQYLLDFENFAVSYSKLVKEIETNPLFQKPFRHLEFTATLFPLLVRLYMQGKLDSLLTILETIEVRVYKLRGTNPIADIYWLSSQIVEYDLTVEEIKNHLVNFSEKFVNNHVFGTYLDGAIYGNGAVKYILSEYSNDNHDVITYKDFQVEHVFSKDPNYDATSYDFSDDYDYEKNRLGNLGLLEKNLNIGLGNLPPINKVNGYLNSQNTEIRNLAGEIQKGSFNKMSVDDRRKNIIDFCVTRFNLG
ncbi:DUF262 domain-containing protein [Flavobacterium sp. PL02]|uniref:DUF262 domain-containing protein n=1 Tax=Flavobacterium sp. PL02 TaxID=3088354 RepID=UPI002B22D6C3|nr:DUF262 domain-containing protein [Flavobacterium sp. PL02]MEA9413469.1 DUF262 domain-containing protein [Flavobacterium sp. PL02]